MKDVKFQYLKFVTSFEDFKQKFPKVKHGNGVVSMRNKIAWQWYTNPRVRKFMKDNPKFWYDWESFMPNEELARRVFGFFRYSLNIEIRSHHYVNITENLEIKSPLYYNNSPLCEDGTSVDGYIKYYRQDNDKTYNMRLGKMLNDHWDLTEFGKVIPGSMRVYISEVLSQDLKAYASKYTGWALHVDDDFEGIYDRDRYEDGADFHSCMVGKDLTDFYTHFDANAAYITNANNKIVARCILWNKVHHNGKIIRFADRQYAEDQDRVMMQLLIDKLIEDDYIDAYKPVGDGCSGCEESVNFIQEDGTIKHKFASMRVYCDCDIIDYLDGNIPYLDTFKWVDGCVAYNIEEKGEYECCRTDGYADDVGVWDDWHEYLCNETTTVYCRGREYQCDIDDLGDFRFVDRLQEYHYYEDTIYCEWCNEYELEEDAYYSELTEEWYCCESCMEEAEQDYKEYNWHQVSWDDEYYEDYEYIQVWDKDHYQEYTMGDTMIEDMLDSGELTKIDGEYYMGVSFLGLPFGEIE